MMDFSSTVARLRFGDLDAKETAKRVAKHEASVYKAEQYLRDALHRARIDIDTIQTKRDWFANFCPHCWSKDSTKRYPWDHNDSDWECPVAGLWKRRRPGASEIVMREAVRRILGET